MSEQTEQLYDRLLVMRSQIGDEDAFRELVDRYAPRLSYFLQRLISDRHVVQDVLQEVWIDVLRQLPRLQDAGAFRTWIYQIARGKATLHRRRNRRDETSEEAVELAVAPDVADEFSPDDAARVHVALGRLKDEHREVLVLRFLEELSYEEIAAIVGCPVGTVRSRIHYAKQALRRRIEQSEQDGSHPPGP